MDNIDISNLSKEQKFKIFCYLIDEFNVTVKGAYGSSVSIDSDDCVLDENDKVLILSDLCTG